ncbi:MAG: PIN domain-containing protein [Flavobacteriales bacterium]|jgi:predicted nucleic acid-binding protein|nr:PIN domain-containing protein [Flavobacteriales bacterium]MBK7941594.1 PIN domain-containing protein [Flavobacteriales bacterium]MBK8949381.1 PIN domain-containing protein [Flavobacteriales bacterium]MBK9700138.1 PIN domain-containing protein [Flavobacteriales bacterium]
MPPKRIFLDANVLVTVLCNEYPRFGACARVLSLADDRRFAVYTSPLCLAIGAYFAEKKNGKKLARKKIALLADKLEVTTMGPTSVERALADARITDIEDGFQYFSALDAGCSCIVTNDRRDWAFAGIEVLSPEDFLLKHVVVRK